MAGVEFWVDGKKIDVVPCIMRPTGRVVEMENGLIFEELEIVDEEMED